MPRRLLMDEIHFAVYARAGLPASRYVAMRRTLSRKRFLTELNHTTRKFLRGFPSLSQVKITISR